jgi:iron-sulfur cluster repair protein YtfE (RIC family)
VTTDPLDGDEETESGEAGRCWQAIRTGVEPTAPPPIRHSRQTVLDEASRPVAAEPDESVEFSRRGAAIGRHLVEVHDHFRAELASVRDILDQVRDAAANIGDARAAVQQMALRLNDWTLGGYCQALCQQLTGHHSLEDEDIFPYLRRSQPDINPVIDRLNAEHHVIHELLDRLDAALIHLVQHPTEFGPVVDTVDLLTDTLGSHFAYEERELIPPLVRFGFFPGQV